MNYVHVDTPLVSVVMPVYNSEAYLAEAIESILAQSYSHLELIIVDDCSTDGSAGIIRSYALADARIHPLYLSHRGAGGAANAGIAAAKGEMIARMDADDIALPERLATQIAWMRRNGLEICGSCVKTFGAEDRLMWFPESHEAIRFEMLFRCALMQPTVMMHTDIAKKHPYNENLYFEDYELWTRLAPKYRMGNIPQVLLKYRTHMRQRHIQNAADVRTELRKYCKAYFRVLFPDATPDDDMVIANVVCNEPLKSLAELERAGELLTYSVSINDQFLHCRMAERWMAICRRSAFLGFGAYRLYREKVRGFGSEPEQLAEIWLALASLLHLQNDSRMEMNLRKLVKLVRK